MGLICTYIFQSFVYSCNVRYSTKKKNKNQTLVTMNFLSACLVAALASATHLTYAPTPTGADLTAVEDDAKASMNAAFLPLLS